MEEKTILNFTEEEVNEIKQLQQKVVTLTSRIGEIELNIQELETTFESLKMEKTQLFSAFTDLKQEESVLSVKLQEKYGEGTYDINTNTFTPNK